jgi:hypothetical protein
MKFFNLRTAFATLSLVILTACGGENMNTSDASRPDQLSASVASGGTPLPDCAPEACKQPRIIDGLAEEFRAGAMARSAQQDDAADAAPAAASPAEAAPTVLTAPTVTAQ